MGNGESTEKPPMCAWSCEICGEVTLAREHPSECPFCGSGGSHVISLHIVVESRAGSLTDADRGNLAESLRGERTDVYQYAAMSKNAPDAALAAMFDRVSKMEREHAKVFARLLGIFIEDVATPAVMTGDPKEIEGEFWAQVGEAIKGERAAMCRYAEYAGQTADEHLRMIWRALAKVEGGHLELFTDLMAGIQ
jgi:rubrerythrin